MGEYLETQLDGKTEKYERKIEMKEFDESNSNRQNATFETKFEVVLKVF